MLLHFLCKPFICAVSNTEGPYTVWAVFWKYLHFAELNGGICVSIDVSRQMYIWICIPIDVSRQHYVRSKQSGTEHHFLPLVQAPHLKSKQFKAATKMVSIQKAPRVQLLARTLWTYVEPCMICAYLTALNILLINTGYLLLTGSSNTAGAGRLPSSAFFEEWCKDKSEEWKEWRSYVERILCCVFICTLTKVRKTTTKYCQKERGFT